MKIAAVCCTYLRPRDLARLLRCFELQDYADRELVILDDAGQYGPQSGDRWRLFSYATRFATLGQKRNAAAALVGDDVQGLAVWDDDDLYLPWALSASAAALGVAPWSRPSLVLHPQPDGSLRQHQTGGLFHGGWAYRREAFWQIAGYPDMDNGEDQALARRFQQAGLSAADPLAQGFAPFYIYRWGGPGWHLSGMGRDAYRQLGSFRAEKATLTAADPEINLQDPEILPEIHPRVF
jgi:hypothetical protein